MDQTSPSAGSSESDTAKQSRFPLAGPAAMPTPTSPSSAAPSITTAPSPSPPSPNRSPSTTFREIPINAITVPTPKNGRLELKPASIAELAFSISKHGLDNPITVRQTDDTFELIAGQRRLTACKQLGHTDIPARVIKADDQQSALLRLSENSARSNLSPVEEALQLAELAKNPETDIDMLARHVGRSTNWVLDRLDMMDWPETLLTHIHDKLLGLAAAKLLVRITPEPLRDYYIRAAATNGCNTKTAALWLQQALLQNSEQIETSENVTIHTTNEYVTETKIVCFTCQQPKPLEQTQRLAVCNECIEQIHRTAQEYHAQPHP